MSQRMGESDGIPRSPLMEKPSGEALDLHSGLSRLNNFSDADIPDTLGSSIVTDTWGSPYSQNSFDFGLSPPNKPSSTWGLSSPIMSPSGSVGSPMSAGSGEGIKSAGIPRSSSAKQNIAAFGAKLSTAASAAAHATKYKPKNSSDGDSSGLRKSKMFRQSKSDLKNLRMKTDMGIQAARQSINDRSPMTRSSRELERIAAITPTSVAAGEESDSRRHHHHHPHISFRKKDNPAAVLSSSASNSKLASEGSMYSFQSAPNASQWHATDMDEFRSPEECAAFLTKTWSQLCKRSQPIFKSEWPSIPVEDTNILVKMYFGAHYHSQGSPREIIDRLNDFLCSGLKGAGFGINLSGKYRENTQLLRQLAISWHKFITDVLPALEAVFLPLQLEFDGCGAVLQAPEEAQKYWKSLQPSPKSLAVGAMSPVKFSVRRIILVAYRDVVMMPLVGMLEPLLADTAIGLDSSFPESSEMAASLLQCVNVLSFVQTNDVNQKAIEELLLKLKPTWMARPRLAKDRSGLVLRRD